MIEIKRQKRGRTKTRFEIVLSLLKPRYKRILLKNSVIKKNSEDDRFLRCLFRIEDSRVMVSYKTRPFVNLETREISTYASVKDSYKILDWKCAFCKTNIKSRIDKFEADNFCCEKCYTYYIKDSKKISQLVIDSMVSFTDHYKKKMIETQKQFIKYIKKNEKRHSLL
jgi:hypothetical protein